MPQENMSDRLSGNRQECSWARRWMLIAASFFLLPGTMLATAQQARPPDPNEELFTFFYKNARPEKLVGFIEKYDATANGKWEAYPPFAGFFAIVFRTHPAQIERIVPARLTAQSATAIAAALRLAGNQAAIEKLQPRFEQAGSDEKLKAQFVGLPNRLEEISIRAPTHLDILWGAAFASGDRRFVRMIIDYFAQTANRSEAVAIDVAKVAIAIAGGPNKIYGELRSKYANDAGVQIIFAATALWAIRSNSERHAFVEQDVTAYIREHPGTPATKAISALRPKTR